MSNSLDLRVFAFPPAWGLPTCGPFALKLLAWLELTGVPYSLVVEPNSGKGPQGKSPWIALGGERIGDSDLIIRLLSERMDVQLDHWLDDSQRAVSVAVQRMMEDHFHQIFEYELFALREGFREFRKIIRELLPPVLAQLIGASMRRHFLKQLHARGVARHKPNEIARQGKADLEAIAVLLGDKPWLFGDRPTTLDCSVLGLVAPLVFAPFQTPVASHARSLENVARYCRRICGELFSDESRAAA